MAKALIILILLGCDDAVTQCDLLTQRDAGYRSEADCRRAADRLLEQSLDQPYPTLVTQCGTAAETLAFLRRVASAEDVAAAVRRFGLQSPTR